jgi:hypothetical protein
MRCRLSAKLSFATPSRSLWRRRGIGRVRRQKRGDAAGTPLMMEGGVIERSSEEID